MLALARHYARFRSAYPTDRLVVAFEIDGPLVDQRHKVRLCLRRPAAWPRPSTPENVGQSRSTLMPGASDGRRERQPWLAG
jgi:hypothetical protein